ncbi:mavicyanin [Panicum miliaceum]|uniref:Mavicyanin n=1 Tax=Panicum miliaceum TaxID=4540 RepID=A0A3L6TS99_PANMI|nr:mavicyanin [Panicum miliaceum]
MRARVALASAAAVLLLLADGGACAMYKVGDLDAWGVPPPSKPDVYKRWAKSIHFALGDSIWFLYPPSQDSVLQVTPQAFAACDLSSPVLKLADGNSVFNLTTPGRAYFSSGTPGHCLKGQKLWVDVPMANGTYLQPSASDLAALSPTPAAEAPEGSLPASAPAGAHPSPALRAVAGAGSVAAAAALSFALPLLL